MADAERSAVMGTARTSPKVVRERRARGIRSNRGKVRRHFPKAHRNDRHLEAVAREGKAWTLAPDQLEAAVQRLVLVANVPDVLRDDLTQELWVKVLEGETEAQIREDLDLLVADVKLAVWGITTLSLSSKVGDSHDSPRPLSDFIDANGQIPHLGHRSKQSGSLRFNRMDRTGIPHSTETRRLMSKRWVRKWAGEYGEERRALLNVYQKVCRKCGYDGPWERFAKNPNCYGGRDKICKPCMVAQVREYKQRRKQLQVAA